MEKPIVLGIDIGGSHITVALVNLETGRIINDSYRRKYVNSLEDADSIIESWCEVINDSFNSVNLGIKKIGIAIPGPFDYEHGISLIKDQDKFKSMYKLNIKDLLAQKLEIPSDHVRFVNDAAGFLKGEMLAGAGRFHNNVLGLTFGTGLGSAISINGRVKDIACWNLKFKDTIAEDYLSGGWFLSRFKELTNSTVIGVKELVELRGFDDIKRQIFLEFAKNLSEFVGLLMEEFELEAVVIGGNISKAAPHFLPELTRLLAEDKLEIVVKVAVLKEDASLIGAADCWENSSLHNNK